MTTIGEKIRDLRKVGGMSQAALARRLGDLGLAGIYPQTITRIEKGQRSVLLWEAPAIAASLGVNIVDLLPGDGHLGGSQIYDAGYRAGVEDSLRKLEGLL